MTSLKLMREFEAGRSVVDLLGDRYITQNGDAYVTLQGLGGEQGARAAFESYAEGKRGTLHWRALPEISPEGGYFMRLFIGDVP